MPAGVGYGGDNESKAPANVPVSKFTSSMPLLGRGFNFRKKKRKKAKVNSIESLGQ